ncbi:MAG TPA: hypothetical protein VD913_05240, partial [bacterium]|nr:hypothetical protein [bacterium]
YDDEHVRKTAESKDSTDYLERLSSMKRKLAQKKGYVVLFNEKVNAGQKWFEIPRDELKESLALIPIAEMKDGAIYQVQPDLVV